MMTYIWVAKRQTPSPTTNSKNNVSWRSRHLHRQWTAIMMAFRNPPPNKCW